MSQVLPVENPFFAIVDVNWVATAKPLATQMGANWVPIGTKLAIIHD